jgi:hypothetical protein
VEGGILLLCFLIDADTCLILFAHALHIAGDAAGITSGAAWRAALEAACEVGSQQVLLGEAGGGGVSRLYLRCSVLQFAFLQ